MTKQEMVARLDSLERSLATVLMEVKTLRLDIVDSLEADVVVSNEDYQEDR